MDYFRESLPLVDKDEYDNLHIIAKADGIASFKIEYCPFCGRKLSEV